MCQSTYTFQQPSALWALGSNPCGLLAGNLFHFGSKATFTMVTANEDGCGSFLDPVAIIEGCIHLLTSL